MLYLDNNATTQVDPAVLEAMLPYLRTQYGNPSSMHRFGQESRQAVERARHQVADLVGVLPREVVFTSGGTEADNAGMLGLLPPGGPTADRHTLVTTTVEHSAVREPLQALAKRGWRVVEVGVDADGRLDLPQLAAALAMPGVALASVMWANNETGVIFDVPAIAALAHERRVPLHVDAVQAVGKLPVDLRAVPVDTLALSAHKFHGPKGVGALIVRRHAHWQPFLRGGPQERDRRGGTENVAGIVGLGAAATHAARHLADGTWERVRALRDALEQGIAQRVPDAHVNAADAPRLPNTSNLGFAGLAAEAILLLLSERDVCASAGAACSSGSLEPSHVLRAMHLPERVAHGSVRLSLSRCTTPAEIEQALDLLPPVIARLRAVLPA
jgi:cysteine desulfurase